MRLYSYLLLIVSSVVSIYIISKANCQNKSTQEVSLYMMSEIESLTYKELKKIKKHLISLMLKPNLIKSKQLGMLSVPNKKLLN